MPLEEHLFVSRIFFSSLFFCKIWHAVRYGIVCIVAADVVARDCDDAASRVDDPASGLDVAAALGLALSIHAHALGNGSTCHSRAHVVLRDAKGLQSCRFLLPRDSSRLTICCWSGFEWKLLGEKYCFSTTPLGHVMPTLVAWICSILSFFRTIPKTHCYPLLEYQYEP